MAAKKKSGSPPKKPKAPKAPKPPKAPKSPKGSDEATKGLLERLQQQPTPDQMVLALSNALVQTLNGQNAGIAMNALAAAAARICLSTKTKSTAFSQLLTEQIEAQASLMLEEQAVKSAQALQAVQAASGKRGRGGKK